MPPAVFIFLTICGAALRAKEVWVRSVVRGKRGNIAGRGRGKVSVVERQKRYRLSTVGEPGRAIKACHGNRRKAIKLAITNMTIDNWTGTETAADMTFIISTVRGRGRGRGVSAQCSDL